MAVLIATSSAVVRVGDRVHRVRRRRTTAHADAQIVAERPDLWEPMRIDFPAEPVAPSAKAVRAWAKEQGIEVPARGPIPDDVVEQYQAEQG